MPTFRTRLFVLPLAAKTASLDPGTRALPPKERPGFAVEAPSIDEARQLATARLQDWGYEVRSMSCLAGSEAHFSAVVYEKPEGSAAAGRE